MTASPMNTVTLTAPIDDGGETITAVTLQRPTSGHLRGLKLLELAQMDVNQVLRLLPRITRPRLSPAALDQLDPADLMNLAASVSSFFFTRDQLDGEAALLQAEIEDAEEVPSPPAGKVAS